MPDPRSNSPTLRAPTLRDDGLQLDEDRRFQRRFWRIQRIAWLLFGAVCLLALLGLTGSGGALHRGELRLDGARVEFPRISRWEGTDEVSITFERPAAVHSFRIGQDFFDRFSVERIQPESAQATLWGRSQGFAMPAQGPGPHKVVLDVRALHFGWTRLDIAIGAQRRAAHILILP